MPRRQPRQPLPPRLLPISCEDRAGLSRCPPVQEGAPRFLLLSARVRRAPPRRRRAGCFSPIEGSAVDLAAAARSPAVSGARSAGRYGAAGGNNVETLHPVE